MALSVLIVDDSSAIRKILHRVLSQAELDISPIHEASDGKEALTMLRTQSVGLVLSDINMPNMDGLEMLRELRADAALKSIPVLMITTEGSQDKVMQAVSLGANGYIRKPFTSEQIKEQITVVLK